MRGCVFNSKRKLESKVREKYVRTDSPMKEQSQTAILMTDPNQVVVPSNSRVAVGDLKGEVVVESFNEKIDPTVARHHFDQLKSAELTRTRATDLLCDALLNAANEVWPIKVGQIIAGFTGATSMVRGEPCLMYVDHVTVRGDMNDDALNLIVSGRKVNKDGKPSKYLAHFEDCFQFSKI